MTALFAGSAFDTLGRINGMRFLYCAGNGSDRTHTGTFGTAAAKLRIDLIRHQCFTLACRTFFVHDMGNIFIPEIL